MALKGWKELAEGGIITEAGNAREYRTGDWRTFIPRWDESKCSQCLTCWVFCPDSSIEVKEAKMVGIDYDHCKGCGICAVQCPKKAIAMEKEEK